MIDIQELPKNTVVYFDNNGLMGARATIASDSYGESGLNKQKIPLDITEDVVGHLTKIAAQDKWRKSISEGDFARGYANGALRELADPEQPLKALNIEELEQYARNKFQKNRDEYAKKWEEQHGEKPPEFSYVKSEREIVAVAKAAYLAAGVATGYGVNAIMDANPSPPLEPTSEQVQQGKLMNIVDPNNIVIPSSRTGAVKSVEGQNCSKCH